MKETDILESLVKYTDGVSLDNLVSYAREISANELKKPIQFQIVENKDDKKFNDVYILSADGTLRFKKQFDNKSADNETEVVKIY